MLISMEQEPDKNNQLINRIFHSLNQAYESSNNAPELRDVIKHLRQENDALRKTLRMHNGLRQRFEQIYDNSPIGYLTISGNGCIAEANLMMARLLGIQRSWLIGQNLDHYIADEDKRLFSRHLDYVRNTRGPDVCTLHIVDGNGEKVSVRMESTPCLSEAQSSSSYSTIYVSLTLLDQPDHHKQLPNDLTEDLIADLAEENDKLKKDIKYHKSTESALLDYHEQLEKLIKQQSRKLESLKKQLAEKQAQPDQDQFENVARLNSVVELASGLAHEINQPLSAITTYSQSCLRRLQSKENPQRLQALIEQILVQTQRATHIIRHLRDFISKRNPHREITNINKAIQYAINVLRKEIISNEIRINVKQAKPIPQIMADPIQIEQVILNLLQNSIDALKKVPMPKRELDIELTRSQTHICITIHDTGPGVTQQNADKIIRPFFTTKTDGMGLGLAISRAIILDHGGELAHKKNLKKGATFVITLAIDGQSRPNYGKGA